MFRADRAPGARFVHAGGVLELPAGVHVLGSGKPEGHALATATYGAGVSGDGEIIWEPPADVLESSHLGRFVTWLANDRGLEFDDYDALWRWSVDDLDGFWGAVWDHFNVGGRGHPTPVLADDRMPGAEWFPGAALNYAGEILRRNADRLDATAIVAVSQTRDEVTYTFGELFELVGRLRVGLQQLGVVPGDRVVSYMPNIPETAAAFLATASLGALWASCAPEFGAQAVVDRFSQLDPKVLFAVDGYRYGDKDVDIRDRVAKVRAGVSSIDHVIGLSYNGRSVADSLSDVVGWDRLVAEHEPFEAVEVPFDHPLWVLFSSGTTGLPKAIVHGHGGVVLEQLKQQSFHWDLGPDDRLLWFTTTAWVMWNALVSTLVTGTSIVMIDGNLLYPDHLNQWRLAEATKPTLMGLSPAYVMACAKEGLRPADDYDVASLRGFGASGSPLPAEGYLWLGEQFPEVRLNVGSGGTDICTGIVQGNPMLPVYAGEMSGVSLGVAACAFDEDGNEVVGSLGELVIRRPMPTMPLYFWDDPNMERYRAAYYDEWPGVMRFGDWVRFTERRSNVITGRSDATLNRAGVRIGTAELYRVVDMHPDVADSMVVHLEDSDGGPGELILFVAPAGGRPLDDSLRRDLAAAVRAALSPRHVPDTYVEVTDIARNLTGKKLELPIKKILQGADPVSVVSREAMANPDSLDDFLRYAQARNST